jgi:hypothetical protein
MARSLILFVCTLVCFGVAQPSKRPSAGTGKQVEQQQAKPGQNQGVTGNAPPPANPLAPKSEATAEHDTDQRDKRSNTDWWLVAFTAALVAVGSLQWWALRGHEKWMEENVKVVRDVAEAAKKNAEAAAQNASAAQLHAQAVLKAERPWIISIIKRDDSNVLKCWVVNYGRTPGEIIAHNFDWSVVTDEMRELPIPPNFALHSNVLSYPKLLTPQDQPSEVWSLNTGLIFRNDPETESALLEDRKRFMIFGCVQYRDMLDETTIHETRFCWRYDPRDSTVKVSGPKEYHERT